jgi:oligopeptide transport system substrate-binding protein
MDVVSKWGDQWTSPEHIVTLGPYNLKVWQHDKLIMLERNDKYFGDKPQIKNIAVYMIQEQATAINLFDSGRLDSVHHLPSVELRKLSARKEFHETGILQIYYYGINVEKPPMNNVLVRKAIAMAIDRKELVQMLAGGELPLSSWIPPGMFGYEPQIGIQFDPAKAKELLRQAGYKDLKTFPKIEIKFNTNEDHQRIAENIQAQLKKNLGVEVELKNEEWKVYLNTLKTGPSELFRFGWLADYPDPDNFLSMMASFSENNHTRWKNPKFDELLLKGASETDRAKRREYYAAAQKIMIEDDVAVIPLYASVSHMLVSPRVENYPISSLDRYDFKGVKLK